MSTTTGNESTAWEKTLTEAAAMAEELREKGWEVCTVRAGHVEPVMATEREEKPPGLVYVVPDDVTDRLPDFVDRGNFERYQIYRRTVGSDLFMVLRLIDPVAELAILLVGAIDLDRTRPKIDRLRTAETINTYVQRLDGTRLVTMTHEDPGQLFPDPI
ncbi:MAG: hypothetical protein ABEI98_08505 [Halorhabdus sp.]